MKVALVHDYLLHFGGGERVLLAMHKLWPEAPVFTSIYDPNCFREVLEKPPKVYYSRLQRTPLVGKFYKYFTFFYPLVFESFDFSEYDVVISSSSNFAKGIITGPQTLHISFCHTPPRFLYGYPTETNRRKHWFWCGPLAFFDHWLRLWDYQAAQRVDYFIASSKVVAKRIEKFYRRQAEVIYPPVGIGGWKMKPTKEHCFDQEKPDFDSYFLVVSRLAVYKRVDLAIKACNRLGQQLKIVGRGSEEQNLKKIAGSTIEFLGFLADEKLADYYSNCQAVIFPTMEEDFGVVPVEAMSFGKPVIALKSGGVIETIIDGRTGIFFGEPTVESLAEAIEKFNKDKPLMAREWKHSCLQQAEKFSAERFNSEVRSFVEEKWKKYALGSESWK